MNNTLAEPGPEAVAMPPVATGRPRGRLPLAGAAALVVRRLAGYAAVIALAALLWQAAVWAWQIPPYLLPGLGALAEALGTHGGEIAHATGLTLQATLAGMLLATLIAVVLALAFIASAWLDAALMPLVIVVRTVPMIAIAPVLVLIFGRDRWNSIGMVALLSFFQIMLAARQGFESPSRHMRELFHSCGAGFWATLWRLRVPCALPHLFTGLRIASASALLSAMFAEWLSGAPGLGSAILDAHSKQDFATMWVAVLAGTTASYAFFTATLALERVVQDWSR
jgi:NitT/TauT family transport system permease protein